MQKDSIKSIKVLSNFVCSPLILITNNLELSAKYLPRDFDKNILTSEINKKTNGLFPGLEINQEEKFLIAENNENIERESVLVSEIIIEGWENHPEGRKSNICENFSKI